MKINVVRIGNSQGIRIPKTILQQCHLAEEVELEVQDNQLLLRPVLRPRKDWEEKFRNMHQRGDDKLLDRDQLDGTRWDNSEWGW